MAFGGRFNDKAHRALISAQEAARQMGHDYVGTEHLLLGLLKEPPAAIAKLLRGVDYDAALAQAVRLVGRGNSVGERLATIAISRPNSGISSPLRPHG